jgi:tRNA C32,U32 (ribose-2'-O)-methylase TrmJ
LKTVLEEHQQSRIGLLFGPESSGLSNEDLSYCHYSCFIPTPSHTDYHSLNLAQAIQVVAYTCSQMMEVPSWQEQEQKNGEKQNSQGYSYDFLERWLDETLAKEAFKAFTQRTTLAQTQKKARIMLQRLVRSQEDLDFLCGFIKVYSKGM